MIRTRLKDNDDDNTISEREEGEEDKQKQKEMSTYSDTNSHIRKKNQKRGGAGGYENNNNHTEYRRLENEHEHVRGGGGGGGGRGAAAAAGDMESGLWSENVNNGSFCSHYARIFLNCFPVCCNYTKQGCYYFGLLLVIAATIGLIGWVSYLTSRVEALEHTKEANKKQTCALHMVSWMVRPEPDPDHSYAMAHGSLTLDQEQHKICYNVVTANITIPISSIAMYGPLWSLEPEITDLYLDLILPNDTTIEPGMYTNCVDNVSDFIFTEFRSKISLFYVSIFCGDPAREVARSYLDSCS